MSREESRLRQINNSNLCAMVDEIAQDIRDSKGWVGRPEEYTGGYTYWPAIVSAMGRENAEYCLGEYFYIYSCQLEVEGEVTNQENRK